MTISSKQVEGPSGKASSAAAAAAALYVTGCWLGSAFLLLGFYHYWCTRNNPPLHLSDLNNGGRCPGEATLKHLDH